MDNQIQTVIRRDEIFGNDLKVYFRRKMDNGIAWVSRIEWEFVKDAEVRNVITPDCLSMSPSSAQQMMDALWDVGLRPSEGTGSAGAMKAVQDHLKDMRALVFKHKVQI